MTYHVTLVRSAKQQMLDNANWWSQNRSVEQAARWLDGFEAKLQSLDKNPHRCLLARESSAFDTEIREIHFGLGSRPTHRAIFEIRGEEVVIFAIRHLAQSEIAPVD